MNSIRTLAPATRRDCLRLLGGAGALSMGFGVGAQTYPSKTVTLIVPYAAGGRSTCWGACWPRT